MFRFLASTVAASVASGASAASGTSSEAAGSGGILSTIGYYGFFAVIIVAMYFIMIRPQRKKEKEQKLMRSALEVGDEIVTIGGISGRIVNIKDDSVVIETGSDRDKIKIMKWAIQQVTTLHDSEESK